MKKVQAIEKLIRAELSTLKAYSSIEPLEALSEQTGLGVEGIIKLDGNENPYGCSPRVQRALSNYPYYHIYPDTEQRKLRKALEEYTGITGEHIIVGSGSDELIDLILRLFIKPGDKVINCVPTFGMYPFSTEVCGGKVVNVSRNEGFAVDIAKVKAAIDKSTKVIFIASPNNPSGDTTPEQDILELVKTGIVVVVDEAYYEFSRETLAHLVTEYDNLMVLRTFSKWAGLAGLRVGYGIFPQKVAQYLMKIKPPYNVNAAAQIAALESLADLEYLQVTIQAIIMERERLFTELKGLGLHPLPSKANFILCAVDNDEAPKLYYKLRQKGIFTRYFDTPQLKNYIRISVGKPEHTDALIEALKGYLITRGKEEIR